APRLPARTWAACAPPPARAGDLAGPRGPGPPALEQRRGDLTSEVVTGKKKAGAAHEARQRLAHVSQADESHVHRFLRFWIALPRNPTTGAHYTDSGSLGACRRYRHRERGRR